MPLPIPPWQQVMPAEIVDSYEQLLAHPDSHTLAHMQDFKKACLDQEYYMYLAQLAKLEAIYGEIPLEI